jgi:hypothetical protein
MTASFWSFATLPMTEVLLAALTLQTLWFILFATFTTANARDEQRQFCKHCKNRKLEFTGILRSWIKRFANLPRAIFWSTFTLKCHRKHVRWKKKSPRIYSNGKIKSKKTSTKYALVAMDSRIHKATHSHYYNSDSFPIMLDNRASKWLMNVLSDFIVPPKPTSVRIKGIGGARVSATYVGTVKWCFEDDSGRKHEFVLPETYYSPAVPGRILSLQHWTQVANDNTPKARGTYSATFDDCIELFWDQRSTKRQSHIVPVRTLQRCNLLPDFGCSTASAPKLLMTSHH